MAKSQKISTRLQGNAKNWVEDRIDNGEALMLREFFAFMKDLGFEISSAQKKQLAAQMKPRYARWKAATRK